MLPNAIGLVLDETVVEARANPAFWQLTFMSLKLLVTTVEPGVFGMNHEPLLLLRVQLALVAGPVSIEIGCLLPLTIEAQPVKLSNTPAKMEIWIDLRMI